MRCLSHVFFSFFETDHLDLTCFLILQVCFGQIPMKLDQVNLLFETCGNLFNYFLESLLHVSWFWYNMCQVLPRALSKFDPNASNSNYNEISPHCNGSNSNFPQFQGDSPSVTKGTSGVAVVGTRGELNRYLVNRDTELY